MEIAPICPVYDFYSPPQRQHSSHRRKKDEAKFVIGECQYEGVVVYEYTSTGKLIPVHVLRERVNRYR